MEEVVMSEGTVVSDKDQVLAAARARADMLSAGDTAGLRALLHPAFGWISHRGEIFDREQYLAANTGADGLRPITASYPAGRTLPGYLGRPGVCYR
jgi:hypothetical protein